MKNIKIEEAISKINEKIYPFTMKYKEMKKDVFLIIQVYYKKSLLLEFYIDKIKLEYLRGSIDFEILETLKHVLKYSNVKIMELEEIRMLKAILQNF